LLFSWSALEPVPRVPSKPVQVPRAALLIALVAFFAGRPAAVSASPEAVTIVRDAYGVPQSRWRMPALLESYRDLGAISPLFGPTMMERENRGSFNLVTELGQPVRGEIIVPPATFTGADLGHEPPHLRDQLPLYEAFQYRRQPFTEADLEAPLAMETIPVTRRR